MQTLRPSRLAMFDPLFSSSVTCSPRATMMSANFQNALVFETRFGKVERHRRKALKSFNRMARKSVSKFLNQ